MHGSHGFINRGIHNYLGRLSRMSISGLGELRRRIGSCGNCIVGCGGNSRSSDGGRGTRKDTNAYKILMSSKPFPCLLPLCTTSYKQQNGLMHHLARAAGKTSVAQFPGNLLVGLESQSYSPLTGKLPQRGHFFT